MPDRSKREDATSFANAELQRWLAGLVTSGRLDKLQPVRSWSGPRRLWQFSGDLRWVWNQGHEYQAFEEFGADVRDSREAYELNGYVTGLLVDGETPAGALFKALDQFGSTDKKLLSKLMSLGKGGFAVFGKVTPW
jgi:hypothetical protein